MDSGASQHMTGREEDLDELSHQSSSFSHVTIGDNSRFKVLGRGKVVISNDTSIENVLLVESLGFKLLSVIQLAKCGYDVYFDEVSVIVIRSKTLKVDFVGHVENDMYVVNFSKETTLAATCLMATTYVGWLCTAA